jgi:hypothetical protein
VAGYYSAIMAHQLDFPSGETYKSLFIDVFFHYVDDCCKALEFSTGPFRLIVYEKVPLMRPPMVRLDP